MTDTDTPIHFVEEPFELGNEPTPAEWWDQWISHLSAARRHRDASRYRHVAETVIVAPYQVDDSNEQTVLLQNGEPYLLDRVYPKDVIKNSSRTPDRRAETVRSYAVQIVVESLREHDRIHGFDE